jgi:hypothetical protein
MPGERSAPERSSDWEATRASEVASHLPALPPRGVTPDLSAVSGAMTPETADKPPAAGPAAGPRAIGPSRAPPARASRTEVAPAPSASQARALDPLERDETPVPVRSNALEARFHRVRMTSGVASGWRPDDVRGGVGVAGWGRRGSGWGRGGRARSGGGGTRPAVRDGDLFVETHKAIDFRLSELARRCPLVAKVALVRRGI